jgi:hypothetical protein
MKNIFWLASYPKSGNTWFRVFLANLLQDSDKPVNINQLEDTSIASSRWLFEEAVGIEASDLLYEEVDRLRPEVYRFLSNEAKKAVFLKIHDAYTFLDDGRPLVPPEATRGVIYIIRSPLDVAVSFANHSGISIHQSIKRMNNEAYYFCNETDRPGIQLRQQLLSWSGHVRSWMEAEHLDRHLLRFEDMKCKPLETFTGAVKFLGIEKSAEQIQKALEFSHISELQRQEREYGFVEKSAACLSFFHKGEIGSWRGVLTDKQVETIINAHQNVMKQFGYLNVNNEPLF